MAVDRSRYLAIVVTRGVATEIVGFSTFENARDYLLMAARSSGDWNSTLRSANESADRSYQVFERFADDCYVDVT